MAKASTAVAPKKGDTLPNTINPAFDIEGIGTGMENVTAADLIIPRITLIQKMSPQVDPTAAEYDKTLSVGDVYDVGLKQKLSDPLLFLACHYVKQWLEWAPRSSGKGLQGIHFSSSILEQTTPDERRRPVLPNGNYIAETMVFYGLLPEFGYRKCFWPVASTQLKKGRRLITLCNDEKIYGANGNELPPILFYRCYTLGTVPEKNNDGSWIGWTVERGPETAELDAFPEVMETIKNFRAGLDAGSIRADLQSMDEEAGGPVIDHDNGAM